MEWIDRLEHWGSLSPLRYWFALAMIWIVTAAVCAGVIILTWQAIAPTEWRL